MTGPTLHLAVAFEGAGWHPGSWREPDARPGELFTAEYWRDLVLEAQRGLLDFVTIEDALGIQTSTPDRPDGRVDQVRGRLDAVLLAARLAPLTDGIGLLPSIVVAPTEPFHLSKAIATLDYVSNGRAGVRVQSGAHHSDPRHFGRRELLTYGHDLTDPAVVQALSDLFEETADYIEVVRRLWDSWEDDAEIRDVATGRFIDRDKLHYIDFEGRFFSVKGPSITPRPPQGQPPVAVLAHGRPGFELAARSADVVFVTPVSAESARSILEAIRAAEAERARGEPPLVVLAEAEVYLESDPARAESRKASLDERDGAEHRSDALQFVGTVTELADLVVSWHEAGIDGFRLRPGSLPRDLEKITRGLVPELQRRGVFRRRYAHETLRGQLGLERPANRYVTV